MEDASDTWCQTYSCSDGIFQVISGALRFCDLSASILSSTSSVGV